MESSSGVEVPPKRARNSNLEDPRLREPNIAHEDVATITLRNEGDKENEPPLEVPDEEDSDDEDSSDEEDNFILDWFQKDAEEEFPLSVAQENILPQDPLERAKVVLFHKFHNPQGHYDIEPVLVKVPGTNSKAQKIAIQWRLENLDPDELFEFLVHPLVEVGTELDQAESDLESRAAASLLTEKVLLKFHENVKKRKRYSSLRCLVLIRSTIEALNQALRQPMPKLPLVLKRYD